MVLGVRAYPDGHKDEYVLSLLSIILGGNMSSRLFINVRERQGLAYYIHTGSESYQDAGYLATSAGVEHKNLVKTVEIILKEYKKIGVALVTSPFELTAEQKTKIEKRLLDTTDYKKMEITYREDKTLIGGLVIRIGDRVVDGTVSSRLAALTSCLMKISLESEKEGVQAS